MSLDEKLSVKDSGGRVEGGSGDGFIDMVRSSNGVGSKQSNNFGRAEVTSIGESSENLVNTIEGLRDSQVGGGSGSWRFDQGYA